MGLQYAISFFYIFSNHSMTPQPAPPTLLSQHQFNVYANAWSEAVEYGDSLPDVFQRKGQKKLAYVSFPLQSIVWLLSTVGVRHIRAAFLVKPDDTPGTDPLRPHFTLAFFATDAIDGRISAYYVGDNHQAPSADQDADEEATLSSGPVPHGLAAEWLHNWTDPKAVPTSAMFTTNYGPLQGYVFDIEDFLDPLFLSQPFEGKVLRIGFGLHEYYALADSADKRTQTFGLVLRIYDAQGSLLNLKGQFQEGGGEDVDNTFYDLTHPYPPGA